MGHAASVGASAVQLASGRGHGPAKLYAGCSRRHALVRGSAKLTPRNTSEGLLESIVSVVRTCAQDALQTSVQALP